MYSNVKRSLLCIGFHSDKTLPKLVQVANIGSAQGPDTLN